MCDLLKKATCFKAAVHVRTNHGRTCVRIKSQCEEWCIFWEKQSYDQMVRTRGVNTRTLPPFLSQYFCFFLEALFRTRVVPFLSSENDVFATVFTVQLFWWNTLTIAGSVGCGAVVHTHR